MWRRKTNELALRSETRRNDWIRDTMDVIEGDVISGNTKQMREAKNIIEGFMHGSAKLNTKIARNPNH